MWSIYNIHYFIAVIFIFSLTALFCQTIVNSHRDFLSITQADKANASFLKILPRFFNKGALFVFLSDKSIRDTPVVHMREWLMRRAKTNRLDKLNLYRSSLRDRGWHSCKFAFSYFFLPITVWFLQYVRAYSFRNSNMRLCSRVSSSPAESRR